MNTILATVVLNTLLCVFIAAWLRWGIHGSRRDILSAIDQARSEAAPSERQTATAEPAEEAVRDERKPSEPRLLRMVCHPIRCDVCKGPLRDAEVIVTNDVTMAHLKCVVKVHKNDVRSRAYHVLNYTITDAEYDAFFPEKKP